MHMASELQGQRRKMSENEQIRILKEKVKITEAVN